MMQGLRERVANFLAPERIKIPARPTSDIGWGQAIIFQTDDFPKFNPDQLLTTKGTAIYDKMLLDEQVKAVVKFKRDAITSRDWEFKITQGEGLEVPLSDEEITERQGLFAHIIKCLRGSFLDSLNYIMAGMYHGFSMTEIVYQQIEFAGRTWWGLDRLMPKPYDTFEFHVNRHGKIIKTTQNLNGEEQDIDLDKFVFYVHNPEYDEHYGRSDLREAYRSWYSKDVIVKLYGIYLERLAGGFVTATPVDGKILQSGSPEWNKLTAALDHIRASTSMILPSGIKLDIHQPSESSQFEKAIALHDAGIAKSLLVPNLLGIVPQGETGSFAQSTNQLETFFWTLEADSMRLMDTLNEQLFAPLAKFNFPDEWWPMFRFKPLSDKKKQDIIKMWQALVTAGAVESTDVDEMHIRDLMNFPDKGEPLNITPPGGGNMPQGQPNPGPRPNQPDPRAPVGEILDETILGQHVLIDSAVMARALSRVHFNVVDRKATRMEEKHAGKIENKIAQTIAGASERIIEDKLGTPAGGIEFDFVRKDKDAIRRALLAMFKDAWKLGESLASNEIERARKESFKVEFARLGNLAAEFLEQNAFRFAGDLTDELRRKITTILANGVKFSWTTDEITRKVYLALAADGFIQPTTAMEALGISASELASAAALSGKKSGFTLAALNTIVRTGIFDALNEARFNFFTDPELDGFVVALEYSAILDSRTTPICRHLDGRIWPSDSPRWEGFRPPNHFNCRSLLIPVTIDDEVAGKDPASDDGLSKPSRLLPQDGFGGD